MKLLDVLPVSLPRCPATWATAKASELDMFFRAVALEGGLKGGVGLFLLDT